VADQLPAVKIALRRRDHWSSRQEAFDHFRPKSVFARLTDEALWDYVSAGQGEEFSTFPSFEDSVASSDCQKRQESNLPNVGKPSHGVSFLPSSRGS
jgi:hypothetical protein